ncbi:MAG: translation initiation factor eIF-1A [Nanoarchaeota archaeon]
MVEDLDENDFKDITPVEESGSKNEEGEKVGRVKLPRGEEVLGIIEQRLGGNKMMVKCLDGKSRNCRVPGRLKRKLWLRPNDIVLIEPWELDKNKGDVIFKYRDNQIEWLKKNGYLKIEKDSF